MLKRFGVHADQLEEHTVRLQWSVLATPAIAYVSTWIDWGWSKLSEHPAPWLNTGLAPSAT
jgi:hypothetical protein